MSSSRLGRSTASKLGKAQRSSSAASSSRRSASVSSVRSRSSSARGGMSSKEVAVKLDNLQMAAKQLPLLSDAIRARDLPGLVAKVKAYEASPKPVRKGKVMVQLTLDEYAMLHELECLLASMARLRSRVTTFEAKSLRRLLAEKPSLIPVSNNMALLAACLVAVADVWDLPTNESELKADKPYSTRNRADRFDDVWPDAPGRSLTRRMDVFKERIDLTRRLLCGAVNELLAIRRHLVAKKVPAARISFDEQQADDFKKGLPGKYAVCAIDAKTKGAPAPRHVCLLPTTLELLSLPSLADKQADMADVEAWLKDGIHI